MTVRPVTVDLLHDLVAYSHAHGVTAMDVACTVDHDGRVLLVVDAGLDFIDDAWQLPTGPVLPGETLTDALPRALAAAGLVLDEVTGYLGHHDRVDDEVTRVFCFAVAVTHPDNVCRYARIGHRWADPDDLPDLAAPPGWTADPAALTTRAPMSSPEPDDPPLAAELRAGPRGLCGAQAGTELLVRHAAWLHRRDFCDRFVHLHTAHSHVSDIDTAGIDWPAAIAALDSGDLPCSGGEERMLRLAASLADGIPVDLRDALIGLDSRNLHVVAQAVLHTAGR